jgi:hypothetical protein
MRNENLNLFVSISNLAPSQNLIQPQREEEVTSEIFFLQRAKRSIPFLCSLSSLSLSVGEDGFLCSLCKSPSSSQHLSSSSSFLDFPFLSSSSKKGTTPTPPTHPQRRKTMMDMEVDRLEELDNSAYRTEHLDPVVEHDHIYSLPPNYRKRKILIDFLKVIIKISERL